MDVVRIHLAQMSPLLRRMIADLLAPESDMEIVGWAEEGDKSLLAAPFQGADMIITQDKSCGDDDCLDAVVQAAPLTILTIQPNESSSTSISLVRRKFSFEGDGSKALANVIRQAIAAA